MAGDQPPDRPRRLPIGLMVIGSEMVSFTLLGLFLDLVVFGTLPWFTIGLTLLGFIAAFTQLLRIARKMAEPPGSGGTGKSGGSA
jgi:F0F1-type ATP synthase assembly protein I